MNKEVYFPTNTKLVSSDLLDVIQKFDNDDLIWLSGYCSGLAKAKRSALSITPDLINKQQQNIQSQEDILSNKNVSLNILVLYASQTGNSQKIAESLYQQLDQKNLSIELVSMDDCNPKDLVKQQIILLVISTHGEGEPPDDALDFFDYIKSKRMAKLDNVRHAVFGLGDSSYEFFCQTGKDFDGIFTQLGSTPLLKRVDCELDFEVISRQWISSVIQHVETLSPTSKLVPVFPVEPEVLNTAPDNERYTKDNPFTATVLSNQKITGRGSDKCVHHIEISLHNSGIQYLPGDSLGILGKNNLQLVDDFLNVLDLRREQKILINGKEKTLREALIKNLEITLINKDFIEAYIQLVSMIDGEKATWLSHTVRDDYSSFIKQHQIIDVISLVPIQLNAQQLVDLLKPVKPRVYSISSSQQANPEEAHLTVVLKKSNNEKSIRYGMASYFLIETLKEDDEVLIFIEHNKRFKLPASDVSIIMVGAGTGIAPFRAFLQQRQEESALGKNWLFFGNAHFNTDFLYQSELQKMYKQGLLSRLSVAFSRDQSDKIYVQDQLLHNAETVWQWLNEEKACLYVCGDISCMAKDVESTLQQIISEQGGKSSKETKEFIKQLKKENRYQKDVY